MRTNTGGIEQALIEKLEKRIKRLEDWNKEMYKNHRIELTRLEELAARRAEQIIYLEDMIKEGAWKE